MSKVQDYYKRGQRTLTIDEIAEVINSHPWIPAPKNILVLDGDVVTKQGIAVGLTPSSERTIILTPIANQETVLHELVHEGLGLGEFGTQIVTGILNRKPSIMKRNLKYKLCDQCDSHPDLIMQTLRRYGLQPAFTGYPDIRHYVLIEE